MRPQVALPFLVALLAAALLAVGCGGGGGGSDESAAELVQQTFGSNAKVKTGRLTVALDAQVESIPDPVVLKLSGPFESATSADQIPRFDLSLTATSSGQTQTFGATSTGDKGFLRFQGVQYAVPDTLWKQFTERYAAVQKQADSQKQGAPTLKALGIDPRAWLTDPKKAGEAKVGDTDTIHITAGIDVAKLLTDVQRLAGQAGSLSGGAQQFSEADRAELQKSVRSATFDLYTGKDDKRLRKAVLDLQLTTGHVELLLQYDDLDQPQDIKAPANAKSLDGLGSALQGGGGGAQAAPGATNERYLQCVQDAGQDIAKYQACAKYL
jgi:hypothetical protein